MKTAAAFVLGMLLGGTAVWLNYRHQVGAPSAVAAAAPSPQLPVVAAAQGRVEGRTENIEVEASATV